MSKSKHENKPVNNPEGEIPDTDGEPVDASAETSTTTDPLTELRQHAEAAQAKVDENWNLYLRTAAELENLRKRAERDTAAARKYGVEKLAADLLGVRDSLELGLAAAADENAEAKAVLQGMELTLKMLSDIMEKYGVTIVNPAGEAFNPEFHEAMTTQESADQAPNTVLQVLQKGYRLQDRLLRPALVVVSKAPSS